MTSEISSPLEGAVPAEVRLLAWTILYGGEPTGFYMTLAGAEAELARRNTEYPNSAEHRRLVALAAAPSHPPASAVMGEVRMLTNAEIQVMAAKHEVGSRESNNWGFAWLDYAEALQREFMSLNAGKTIPAANEGEKK